jgi:Prokaryotic glutathione synthetase, ATP-grasp domain
MTEDEKAWLGGGSDNGIRSCSAEVAGWRERSQVREACPAWHRCRARLSGWLDDCARGLLFVGGIGGIDGYFTEINVTSPTGIRA